MISRAQCLCKARTICTAECLWLSLFTRLIVLTREHGCFVRLCLERKLTSLHSFCPFRKLVLCTLQHLFPHLLLGQGALPNHHSPCFSHTHYPADELVSAGHSATHCSELLMLWRDSDLEHTSPSFAVMKVSGGRLLTWSFINRCSCCGCSGCLRILVL